MMYILEKKNLDQTLADWSANHEVIAPQKLEHFSQFIPWDGSREIVLSEPHNTRYPPKALFLPQSEALLKFTKFGQAQETLPAQRPRLVFGIRPCDAQAVTLLDTVFASSENHDPYWNTRRDTTIIVGMGCSDPCSTCFCTTVGSGPFSKPGFDALCTDLGDVFAIEVFTDKGVSLFSHLSQSTSEQDQQVEAIQQAATKGMEPVFETVDLKQKLDQQFESKYWEQISQSCLGCGICTFLCPTCFCFDIVDEVQRGERVRNWDTCMFRIYSQEASGHNPLPSRKERTRQRLMHKYSYWLDHAGKIGCTGCGRCVRYCPVGLDIRAMLRTASSLESEVVHAS
ncbi:MAG: 4Fe-4S dicluster domain-containing protein [Anaerolineaceae bacterium]